MGSKISQQEVQWHVAQMIERLELNETQQTQAFKALEAMHNQTKSRIVKASSLQAMVHLASGNRKLRSQALASLDKALQSSIPSLQARARKLTRELEKAKNND